MDDGGDAGAQGLAPAASKSSRSKSPRSSVIGRRPEQPSCFQVFKSTPLGLGAPQGFKLGIRRLNQDGLEKEEVYHTSNMPWYKQRPYLPPPFKILLGSEHNNISARSNAIVGSIKYPGWEGVVGLRAEIEMSETEHDLSFVHEIPITTTKRTISIRRKGVGRQYPMKLSPSGDELMWKGTTKTLTLLDDRAPECNGNLKLVNEKDPFKPEVYAVWKNRTDRLILGALMIFQSAIDGNETTIEEILCSCLAIVCAERLSGRGWLGGVGKRSSQASSA